MKFEKALKKAKAGKTIRLAHWNEDVIIKAQYPTDTSKMTAPYLFVDSRFGLVPWLPTQIEIFSDDWEVVKIKSHSWDSDDNISDDWNEAPARSVI